MNRFVLVISILIVLLPSTSASEEIKGATSLKTLSDYLSYAALNNAGLKAEFEQWKAALEQIPQSRALDDPKFTYSYFIEQVETRVGPQKNKFGIMQTFPWFGEIQARSRGEHGDGAVAVAIDGPREILGPWYVFRRDGMEIGG